MTAPLAFYAPLKPPDDPTPSGDRRMARALVQALARAGQSVELASRLRSYDRSGDPLRQRRIEALGGRLAARLLRRYRARSPAARPRAWLTYHPYHKSPDWLGPVVADELGIPYLLVEASFAPKQAGGPFARGHAASERAIRRADVALALTARDAECLAPLILPPAELRRLPPFLDPGALSGGRERARAPPRGPEHPFRPRPAVPWLLAVAMMRADVKRNSYLLLADALGRLGERSWQLLVVGDGPARCEIEAALSRLGRARVAFAGAVPETSLAAYYAAADLLVWPAVREAYGLAMLEAQAAGLPVIAGREGGVAEVVQDGITGVLCAPRDPAGFAQATCGCSPTASGGGRWVRRRPASSCASAASSRRQRRLPRRSKRRARSGRRGHDAAAADPPRRDLLERERPDPGPRRPRPLGPGTRRGRGLAAAAGLGRGALADEPAAPGETDGGAARGRPVLVEPRLTEMDWGEWEGRRGVDLRAEAPSALARSEAQGLDLRPPGGESPRDVCARLRALAADLAADPAPVVAVCHKGVIRAALALATGWEMRSEPPLRLGRDQALALACHADGRLQLRPPPLALAA